MMQKVFHYLKNVQSEMIKVSWPTRNEVTSATTLVVVFSIAFSLVVKLFDVVLGNIIERLLRL
ncbi:MAG: preprotein translocase subunit SecE [Chitinivibrionales bacterium]|nr:preprotein translocase subunit SecE [Chitinivibrionales bacterium]